MFSVIYKRMGLDGKIYIGQTIQGSETRDPEKMAQLRAGKDGKNYLTEGSNKFSNYIKAHDWSSITTTILYAGDCTEEELNELEKMFIKKYDSYKHGLNSTLGGEGGCLYENRELYKKLKKEKNTIQKALDRARHKNNLEVVLIKLAERDAINKELEKIRK